MEPLRLEDSGQIYSPDARIVAPTYLRDGDAYEQIRISNPVLFRATASMYSSAADLVAFGHGLMKGAVLDLEMREVLLKKLDAESKASDQAYKKMKLSPKDVSQLVAFLRQLNDVSDEEFREMILNVTVVDTSHDIE